MGFHPGHGLLKLAFFLAFISHWARSSSQTLESSFRSLLLVSTLYAKKSVPLSFTLLLRCAGRSLCRPLIGTEDFHPAYSAYFFQGFLHSYVIAVSCQSDKKMVMAEVLLGRS